MISREDAVQQAIGIDAELDYLRWCQDLIEDIYYSVGSCGECKHYSNTRESFCVNIGTSTPKSFFCADFERKDK